MKGLPLALKRLQSRVRTILGLPQALERTQILNRPLIVRSGAVREKPDYDDAWLFACAQHTQRIIDVRSNIGQAAILMLSTGHTQAITLVEANYKALVVAAENVLRNFPTLHVQLVCAFAGELDGGAIQFWTVGTGAAGSADPEHAKTAKRRGISYSIPTITLDKVAEKEVPDLVKIDVEGAEVEVLKGSREIAAQKRTRFFVEMHRKGDMSRNAKEILEWCVSNGYRAWYMAKHIELTDPAQISHRGRCHLLLQPMEWAYPEWLRGIAQGSPIQEIG